MATGFLVSKTLIEYNRNSLEENEEEKEQIYIEFTEQNTDPENNENAIDFRLYAEQQIKEENITLVKIMENYKSKQMRKIIQKIAWWLFDDCGIVPNEKKNYKDYSWNNFKY